MRKNSVKLGASVLNVYLGFLKKALVIAADDLEWLMHFVLFV